MPKPAKISALFSIFEKKKPSVTFHSPKKPSAVFSATKNSLLISSPKVDLSSSTKISKLNEIAFSRSSLRIIKKQRYWFLQFKYPIGTSPQETTQVKNNQSSYLKQDPDFLLSTIKALKEHLRKKVYPCYSKKKIPSNYLKILKLLNDWPHLKDPLMEGMSPILQLWNIYLKIDACSCLSSYDPELEAMMLTLPME